MTDSRDDQTSSSVPPSSNQPGFASPTPYSQSGGEPKKTLSLVSMILGIVGVVLAFVYGSGILFSIAAVILGHLGKRREGLPAKAFWKTGLITGYVGIALAVIVIVIVIVAAIALIAAGVASVPDSDLGLALITTV